MIIIDDVKAKVEKLRLHYKAKNYTFFENGDYNLNIYALRSEGSKVSNRFVDTIGVCYKEDGKWTVKEWTCTTRAGLFYMLNPMNKNGTAIVTEGQHKGVFGLGKHHGKYECPVQIKQIEVWRDNNKDDIYDPDKKKVYKGFFGIHIHKAGWFSKLIGKWSAGCIVFQKEDDFNEFMEIYHKAGKIWGYKFTFTLFRI